MKSEMTRAEFFALMERMTADQQAVFLTDVVFQVTLCARGLYADHPQLANSDSGLGHMNELQHQVSQTLSRVLRGRVKADDERLSWLIETARDAKCLTAIYYAALHTKESLDAE
ncbi:MAG TPA: hypothetical protein VF681_01355 [Abditibacteriaceae bacterium]|jgi:hypothetical protein